MICRLDGHEDQAGAWDVISSATGRVAWDVGTNVLQAARVLARNFDHVLGFEPCRESYEIAQAEAPPNVEVLPIALWSFDGKVRLDEAEYSLNTGQLVSGPDYLPGWGDRRGARWVPCRTLDSLLDHNPAPDFVKIDTEGAEVEVLRGGRRLFSEVCPRLIVECHRPPHGDWIRSFLPRYEFTELRHGYYVQQGGRTWLSHYWVYGGPHG